MSALRIGRTYAPITVVRKIRAATASLPGRAPRMRTLLASILCASSCIACAIVPDRTPAPAPIVRGPIPQRLQHPLALTYLAFRPRRAATQPAGTAGVTLQTAYSSIFENEDAPTQRVVMDGELWTGAARVRYGLGERTDVELELAALYATSGFLDSFIEDFHDFFGLPSGNRESRGTDDFEMRVTKDGIDAYQLDDNEVELLDIPIILTQRVLDETESRPAVALRAGIELPVGSESQGFSNGELDYGAGFVVEHSIDRWTWTAGGDYVATGQSSAFRRASVDANDVWDLQGGAEYRWNDRGSLLGELVYTSPLLTDVSLDQIDWPLLDLGLGVAWDVGRDSRWTATFHEDLFSEAGPDFVVALAWSWRM